VSDRIFKILVFIIFIGGGMISCKSASRDEKFYEKQQEKQLAVEQKAYYDAVDKHNKMQSKETAKMMRETKRQSKKLNKSRQR
jgi:hypothetical protein